VLAKVSCLRYLYELRGPRNCQVGEVAESRLTAPENCYSTRAVSPHRQRGRINAQPLLARAVACADNSPTVD